MTWDGYKEPARYPPAWYSKLENAIVHNRAWIWIALYLAFFFVWPLFMEPEPTHQAIIAERLEQQRPIR